MFHSEVCKLRETLKLSAINLNYGCSFVGKLSWKKKIFFFFEKIFVLFTKYTLFAEKNVFIRKKKFL